VPNPRLRGGFHDSRGSRQALCSGITLSLNSLASASEARDTRSLKKLGRRRRARRLPSETVGRQCWVHQFGFGGRYVAGFLTRHAPFGRVIELAVSRSVFVTVSFPGRACHPLTQFNERRDGVWPS